jgi:hypothetical protein
VGYSCGTRIVAGAVSAVAVPLPEPDNAGGVDLVQWEQRAAIEDRDAPQRCLALDHQTAAGGHDPWQM